MSIQPSSVRERVVAATVALALAGFATAWALTPHVGFRPNPALVGAYGAVLTITQLATAFFLLWRARVVGDGRSAVIASLFVYSTPVVAFYASASFFEPTALQMNAGAWLWLSWRLGSPLAIIAYALAPRRRGTVTGAVAVGLALAVIAISLAYSGVLPTFARDGVYTVAGNVANGAAIAAVLVALLCTLRLRPPSLLDTWLIVLLVTLAVRFVLVAFNTDRLARAPDAIWILSGLIANVCVVLALAGEFTKLLQRSVTIDAVYRRESEITQQLQAAFLPMSLPTVDGLRFEAVYRPALLELGGDWYDAFMLRDGRVAFVIGDIAGHGVEAALEMVRLRETLRAIAGVHGNSVAAMLETVDRSFRPAQPERFATAALAVYDPLTMRLEYACAGHPPPALVRAGDASFLLGATGIPLGVDRQSRFPSAFTTLEVGDRLVLYTDGLIESTADVVAGQARFMSALTKDTDVKLVAAASVGPQQRDDVALLQVTILQTAARVTWSFESEDAASATEARASFMAHLRRRSDDPALLFSAELVFGELIGNVVRHAPGAIEIELVTENGFLDVVVRDRGAAFFAGAIALPEDIESESGRGLFLISALAEPPIVTRRPSGGNQIVVRLGRENDGTASNAAETPSRRRREREVRSAQVVDE